LLIQLLGEFHADKQRARQLKALSYLQAVHETGARLTHDIKNLLQSLQTLCHAADEPGADESPEFRALLRRQLPAIATRLSTTLGKLKAPQDESMALGSAREWWDSVTQRHATDRWIIFELDIPAPTFNAVDLPIATFSSALENLLGNAADKRSGNTGLELVVRLLNEGPQVCLEVCDNGAALPEPLAQRLLAEPVSSQNGLGIGLYQAARLATQVGYQLKLTANRTGCVCFTLKPA
jgi:signal transduction histidine kinase